MGSLVGFHKESRLGSCVLKVLAVKCSLTSRLIPLIDPWMTRDLYLINTSIDT